MNTTPIEKCFIGAHAQLTVDIATAKGWSNFSIFPNGNLFGTAPDGREQGVPDYAQRLKDAAPVLLAALKQYADPMNWGYHDEGGCPKGAGQYEDACFLGREVALAAIAAAEAESEAA